MNHFNATVVLKDETEEGFTANSINEVKAIGQRERPTRQAI